MSDVSQVEQIFLNAVHINPAERAQFLDEQCGQDADLRQRVEKLLAAQPHVGKFLEPSTDEPTHAYSSQKTQPIGTVIANRYSLVEVIGEGGMGTVWRAKQTEPVTRYVALKLIKPGMDSKQVLARFDAERQALAMMDHPNIARILDGGIHDNRPFFVMELVKGTPITEFCDALKLTPQQRLELFLPVCQAIQHAHQKGIIHRDIKPSNVLIALYDDKPVPKVIDFGVAKATGGALTQHTIDTGFGGVVGTPQYMSPEQATFNNLDIDTRSDVYSLGTLLYELLAGSPPFAQAELEQRGLLEILRVVREEEPLRPSLKLSTAEARASISANRSSEPAQLSSMMKGEIDWIVMKALEKDRTRRYDTAIALAKDVQHYLNGDPVEACPPTLSYRVRKFLNKNRTAVRVASAFICLGLSAVMTGAYLAVQAKRAEIEASQKSIEANEAANQAEFFRLLSDGRADRLYLELENSKVDAASLKLDLDLAELKVDAKFGLLRMLETIQALDTTPTERKEHFNSDLFDERYEKLDARKKTVSEFATAAVLTTGQNYAPILPPLTHDGILVRSCQLSSDARVAMTLGFDGTVRLWDSTTARLIAQLREKDERVLVCAFSPDGSTVATDDITGVARLWEDTTGKLKAKTAARPDRYQHPPDWSYERIASFGNSDHSPIFSPNTYKPRQCEVLQLGNHRMLTGRVAMTNQERYPAGIHTEMAGQVDLWDVSNGNLVTRFEQPTQPFEFALLADGKYVGVLDSPTTVCIHSAEDGRLLMRLTHTKPLVQVVFSPSGQRLATWSGEREKCVRVWDTATWDEIRAMRTDIAKSYGQLRMLNDTIAAVTDTDDLSGVINTQVFRLGHEEPVGDYDNLATTSLLSSNLACFADGRLFDLKIWKRLSPPNGQKYHPDLAHFAGDKRFVAPETYDNNDLFGRGLVWIDTRADKSCPRENSRYFQESPWLHRQGFGLVKSVVTLGPEVGQVHVVPTSRLNILPALLQLWAQVAVRGELGLDGEFVKWNEETWEQKRQELAAAKPPYEDFPFPGYVATDKLHWLRAEYAVAKEDKEKLRLIDELLRRSETNGDKNEVVRWQNERAKYVRESVPPE